MQCQGHLLTCDACQFSQCTSQHVMHANTSALLPHSMQECRAVAMAAAATVWMLPLCLRPMTLADSSLPQATRLESCAVTSLVCTHAARDECDAVRNCKMQNGKWSVGNTMLPAGALLSVVAPCAVSELINGGSANHLNSFKFGRSLWKYGCYVFLFCSFCWMVLRRCVEGLPV
jgi:hypothetical protein